MTRFLGTLLAIAVAVPFAAQAQTTDFESNYQEPREFGPSVGVIADVGVSDYNRGLAGSINTGVGYGALIDLSPMRNLGLELGYRGAVNNMRTQVSTDGRVITNQVGGNLRVNLVPATHDLPGGLRPFVFGGAFYHRVDTDGFTPGVSDDINAFALPVGVGLEADISKRFLIGARFTYNFLFNETGANGFRDDTDNWVASVNLGARLGD